ncbi:MAG: hypothetical protein ACHQAX_02055 [Gammaproteobacteria bacterium]
MGMTHLPMFEKDCRLFVAITSFVLTLLVGWDALINPDGILYVTQAHLIHQGAWREALSQYPWPGYATLIAAVSWFGPTLEHSATLINAVCYALMVAGFVTFIKQAGGNQAIQWLAAVALLVQPSVNGYREYIIRDVGLWGMIFWSLYALVHYHEHRQWRDVFLWSASMTFAVLFRIEAIVFLTLAPCALLMFSPRRSFLDLLRFQSLFIAATVIGFLVIMLSGDKYDLGRLEELPRHLEGLINAGSAYMDRAEGLRRVFSDELKLKHAAVALAGAMMTFLLYAIIKSLTPVYLFLVGVTHYKHLFPRSLALRYLWVFIGLAVFILITFFLQLYFLSGRYVTTLALLLTCFVPYGIHYIAVSRNNGTFLGRGFMFPLMSLAMIAMFISGITSFGYSKEYLRESGHWIQTHVKSDAPIFVGEKHVAYYAQRYDALELIDYRNEIALTKAMKNDFKGKDVIALYHDKKTKAMNDYLETHFVHDQKIEFENKRHDGVTIIVLNPSALK